MNYGHHLWERYIEGRPSQEDNVLSGLVFPEQDDLEYKTKYLKTISSYIYIKGDSTRAKKDSAI